MSSHTANSHAGEKLTPSLLFSSSFGCFASNLLLKQLLGSVCRAAIVQVNPTHVSRTLLCFVVVNDGAFMKIMSGLAPSALPLPIPGGVSVSPRPLF